MKKVLFLLAVVSLLVSPVVAQAQDQPYSGPPKVIRIIREEVKVGKGTVHEANETAWARTFAEAKSPDCWFGLDSTTGNNKAWLVVCCGKVNADPVVGRVGVSERACPSGFIGFVDGPLAHFDFLPDDSDHFRGTGIGLVLCLSD